MSETTPSQETPLAGETLLLSYQRALRDYLKAEEAALWSSFVDEGRLDEAGEQARLQLLRSAYPLDPGMHPSLYQAAATAAGRLGLGAPIRLYSAQSETARGIDHHYVPGEIHLVFRGPLLDGLETREWLPALGYGFGRFLLAEHSAHDFWIVERMLEALSVEVEGDDVFLSTAQTYDAYREIFCDRCAQVASGDLGATLSALRALAGAAASVGGAGTAAPGSGAATRPIDLSLRAEALRLWAEAPAASPLEVARLVEPPWALATLDLVGRAAVTRLSRQTLDRLLARSALQTGPVVSLARLFFADYTPPAGTTPLEPSLLEEVTGADDSLRDYLAYFLLDFVAADAAVAEIALGAASLVAEELGVAERFRAVAIEELGVKRKHLKEIEAEARRDTSPEAAPDHEEANG